MSEAWLDNGVIPFVTVGNRRAITDEALSENLWLGAFLQSFSQSFERDEFACCWWFYD